MVLNVGTIGIYMKSCRKIEGFITVERVEEKGVKKTV